MTGYVYYMMSLCINGEMTISQFEEYVELRDY